MRPCRRPASFGLTRALIWMCPGFGGAAVYAGLVYLRRRTPAGPLAGDAAEWLAIGMAVVFMMVFGWFDALMSPHVRKSGGAPEPAELGRWLGLFCFGQILVAPVLFCFTLVVMAEILGVRF